MKPSSAITIVIQLPTGAEFARFALPKPIYARIEQAAKKRHITLAQFVYRAIRNKISRVKAAQRRKGVRK